MNNIPRIRPKVPDSRGTLIDTENCVENVGANRFNLVLIAAARAREIRRQNKDSESREHVFANVTALLEIQEGKVGEEYLKKVK
jgi:DNA-directed RNA polymerase omega subunit